MADGFGRLITPEGNTYVLVFQNKRQGFGRRMKRKGKVHSFMKMESFLKENLRKILKMDMLQKNGQIKACFKEIMLME